MRNTIASPGLPAATTTEEWRVMSATIAFALWSDPARAQQRLESDAPPAAWQTVAADYRARVRATLRQLALEGITFSQGPAPDPRKPMPKLWWEQSARFSWLLWLRKRRSEHGANETLEQIFWVSEAEEYRAYVRNALRSLAAKGINLTI